MDKESQNSAINSLQDWSKWLIGIDFAAATGCVAVLQGGVTGPARPFLILAIAAFALSVLCAALLVRILASVVEQLPLIDADGEPKSIDRYLVYRKLSIGQIAHAQLVLLALGGLFFLAWVAI